MMKIFTIVFILFVITNKFLYSQQDVKIKIVDAETSEALIGAIAYDSIQNRYAVANNYGILQFRIKGDSTILSFSYFGYNPKSLTIKSVDSLILVQLEVQPIAIDSVYVYHKGSKQIRHGHLAISQIEMVNTPVLFAEKDVLKTLQLMPGVIQNRENTSSFTVRGGSSDQNLMLMDGIPVYNINHLYGFVSIFNTDACNKVNFYKGGIPARYGGRLSSVVDVMLREGMKGSYTGGVSLNPIASRLYFEGPLNKSKTNSFLFAGRRTLYDLVVAPIIFLLYKGVIGYYYQDLSLKTNFQLNPKNNLFISTYYGADNFYSKSLQQDNTSKIGRGWNNITQLIRWNNFSFNKTIINTSIAFTRFQYLSYNSAKIKSTNYNFYKAYKSGIDEFISKVDINYSLNYFWMINYGIFYSYRMHNLGLNVIDNIVKSEKGEKLHSEEYGNYIENEFKSDIMEANFGIRIERYTGKNQSFNNILPRVYFVFLPKKSLSYSISYDKTSQYLQLVSNTNIGFPNDLWIPIYENFKPLSAEQYSAGIKYSFGKYVFTAEAFYKKMKEVVDYRDGVILREQYNDWNELLTAGTGRSYGLEIMIEKNYGRLSGWLTYTYSRSFRRFSEINQGHEFPFVYDRPHSGNINLSYNISASQTFNATWFYSSGSLFTIPTDVYQFKDNIVVNITTRNNYRSPFYHHLDIGYRSSKEYKKGIFTIIFGVYNVYGMINPFRVRYVYKDYDKNLTNPYLELSGIFFIWPYFGFEYKFK